MLTVMYIGAILFGFGLIASLGCMMNEKDSKWSVILTAVGFMTVVITYLIGK